MKIVKCENGVGEWEISPLGETFDTRQEAEQQLSKYSKLIGVPAEIYIEHTCDFADQIMQDRLNRSYEDYLLGNDDEGYSYTEEGQDIFNEILIEVENFLAKLNVVNESINFKGEEK
jgi:hypothetical protein